MKNQASNSIISHLKRYIYDFENKKLEEKESNLNFGVVFTPKKITNFMANEILKIYFKELIEKRENLKKESSLNDLVLFMCEEPQSKAILVKTIQNIKILDPSCGSGRFLISVAKLLLKIKKILNQNEDEFEIKKQIIHNNIFGVEINNIACDISKLRLLIWLYSSNNQKLSIIKERFENNEFESLDVIYNDLGFNVNIINSDYLIEFELKEKFDIIIGNPPYVKNNNIKNLEFKKKIYKKFQSAYKLFDLSIVFLEKSLEHLKDNKGCLSFLMTNKFLAADYGIKIRELLIKHTELKELINISSLKVFEKAAAYPIIISFRKRAPNSENVIVLKNYNNLNDISQINGNDISQINGNDISQINGKHFKLLSQSTIKTFPGWVIPILGDIVLVQYLFNHYKQLIDSISDVKITYRPFGFLNWAKHFDNIAEERESNMDLMLIGTGNVGKYHIKLDKRIKIAKKDLEISFFKYNKKYEKKWKILQNEKIIFREIAKELTCVYDPGIFANITGLYCISIPSFDTNKLYCLLTLLNSKLIDLVFKTLFSTLHMSGGYLRFNGSFVKRLPIPESFPSSLSYLGKINQLLSQIQYNSRLDLFKQTNLSDIKRYLDFFCALTDSLVYMLYFNHSHIHSSYPLLNELLRAENGFPNVEYKFILFHFKFDENELKNELDSNLLIINELFLKLNKINKLKIEIESVSQKISLFKSN